MVTSPASAKKVLEALVVNRGLGCDRHSEKWFPYCSGARLVSSDGWFGRRHQTLNPFCVGDTPDPTQAQGLFRRELLQGGDASNLIAPLRDP